MELVTEDYKIIMYWCYLAFKEKRISSKDKATLTKIKRFCISEDELDKWYR